MLAVDSRHRRVG